MVREVVHDFQATVLQVSDVPYDEESVATIPQMSHEFPNGYNNEFGVERFKIPEALFDTSFLKSAHASSMLSVSHVVTTSVGEWGLVETRHNSQGWVFCYQACVTLTSAPHCTARSS
jgi:actin-related protein